MSNKYEDLIKNARMNADCGEHMSPAEVTTLLNVVEITFAALAAENAGLSAVLMSVIDPSNEPAYQSLGMGCGVEDNSLQTDGYGACEYGWREAMERVYSEVIPEELPETPATDAFLAEVRAQGVEMFAEMYACEAIKDGDVEGWKSNVSNAASEYAAQLRKEAAQ